VASSFIQHNNNKKKVRKYSLCLDTEVLITEHPWLGNTEILTLLNQATLTDIKEIKHRQPDMEAILHPHVIVVTTGAHLDPGPGLGRVVTAETDTCHVDTVVRDKVEPVDTEVELVPAAQIIPPRTQLRLTLTQWILLTEREMAASSMAKTDMSSPATQ